MQYEKDCKVKKELELIIKSIKEINHPSNSQPRKTHDIKNFCIYLPLGKHLKEE